MSRWRSEPLRDAQDQKQTGSGASGVPLSGMEKTGKPAKLVHELRRSLVRNLIRVRVPERVAMMISGRMTRSVFDGYRIVSERDLREAARRLDGT